MTSLKMTLLIIISLIMTLLTMTLLIMTLLILTLLIMTLLIMTSLKMTFLKMTFLKMTILIMSKVIISKASISKVITSIVVVSWTCTGAVYTMLSCAPFTSCHRHLRNIDCLMARTACLVCFIRTDNGCSQKKEEKKPITSGASSGHITKLKQSILLRCRHFVDVLSTFCRRFVDVLSTFCRRFVDVLSTFCRRFAAFEFDVFSRGQRMRGGGGGSATCVSHWQFGYIKSGIFEKIATKHLKKN